MTTLCGSSDVPGKQFYIQAVSVDLKDIDFLHIALTSDIVWLLAALFQSYTELCSYY